jgi:hypothetical protein
MTSWQTPPRQGFAFPGLPQRDHAKYKDPFALFSSCSILTAINTLHVFKKKNSTSHFQKTQTHLNLTTQKLCLTSTPQPSSPTSTLPLALPKPFSATSLAALPTSSKARPSKTRPNSRTTPPTPAAPSQATPPQAAAPSLRMILNARKVAGTKPSAAERRWSETSSALRCVQHRILISSYS